MEESNKTVKICDQKHESQIFAFCLTDSCYTCEKCFEKSHRGHNVEYLKFLIRDHIKAAETMEEILEKNIYSTEQSMQIYSKKQLLEKINFAIRGYYSEIIKVLKNSCENMIGNINKALYEEISNLEKLHKFLNLEKDKMIVLLCEIRQQIRTYEKDLQNNKFKWFHEHYIKLCDFETQTKELTKSSEENSEKLCKNFPEIDFSISVKDLIHIIEGSIKISSQNTNSNQPPDFSQKPLSSSREMPSDPQNFSISQENTAPINKIIHENTPISKPNNTQSLINSQNISLNQTAQNPLPNPNQNRSKTPKINRVNSHKTLDKNRKNMTPTPSLKKSHSNFTRNKTPPVKNTQKSYSEITKKNNENEPRNIMKTTTKFSARNNIPSMLTRNIKKVKSVFFIDQNSGNLLTVCLPNKEIKCVSLYGAQTFPDSYAIVELFQKIFICGGQYDKTIISDSSEIDPITSVMVPRSPMLTPRRNHGLVSIKEKAYAIGGYGNEQNVLNKCEMYTQNIDNWQEIPSLNAARNFMSVCTFNEKNIYVFGGSSAESVKGISSYEWICIDSLNAWKWQQIDTSQFPNFSIGYGSGCIQISQDLVLIFGGLDENSYFNHSGLFSVSKGSVTKNNSLKIKDAFYQRTPIICDKKIYALGFLTKSLHVYDMDKKSWSIFNVFPTMTN